MELPKTLAAECTNPVSPVSNQQQDVETAMIVNGLALKSCRDKHSKIVTAFNNLANNLDNNTGLFSRFTGNEDEN